MESRSNKLKMKNKYLKDCVIAGIVTYNPDIERLQNNIEAVICQVDKIVIVDNGSSNIGFIKNVLPQNVFLIELKHNEGIAKALSIIMDYAIEEGYLWVLTIDQDSIIRAGLVDRYLEYANRDENSNTGMFTCLIKDRNFRDVKHEKQIEEIKKIDSCITSGAFCNVNKYKCINGYDISFFIDCVDFDICYQLREAGFDVCRINYLGLLHEVGRGENRRFLFWVIVIYHHNEQRIYTLSRNLIYLWKKHSRIFGIERLIKKELSLIIRILFYEDRKMIKFKSFIRGIEAGVYSSI